MQVQDEVKTAPVEAAASLPARLIAEVRSWLAPIPGVETNKPANVVYGVEEVPPWQVRWLSALQQMAITSIYLVYPLILAHAAGLSTHQIINMLQLGCIVLGIASVLQALPRGPVGSRMLAPSTFGGIYLASSLVAIKAGGLPLLWGMTIFAGIMGIAFSFVWHRLRALVPPETAGLVVFFVGSIIALAACRMLFEGPGGGATPAELLLTVVTIALIVAINIWFTPLKIYCIVIGMAAGFCLAIPAGLISPGVLQSILELPLISAPSLSGITWAFDWALVLPFAVTALAAAMSTTAVLTTIQRTTDANWVRPDMPAISRGVLGDGISTILGGVLGISGVMLSNANAGVLVATGVASRIIAFSLAAILALVALQPRLLGILTLMPRSVMAAAMFFTAAFIMIGGIQIISTRVLDNRRTLVIGMGLATFFGLTVYPSPFAGVPHWIETIVATPLVAATLVALGMNLVFRIGIKKTVTMTVDAATPALNEVTAFIERAAGTWGARRDVTNRVEFAVQQSVEAIVAYCDAKGPVTISLSFDEFVIVADVTYVGKPMEFPDRPPSKEELFESDDSYPRLAGFLVRQNTDRAAAIKGGVRLRFDH